MRPRLLRCLLLVSLLGWVPQPALAGAPPAKDFKIEKLAEGVYAVIRTYPPGLMCDGNSVFIIDGDGVVVVDAPEASREMLAALRKLTKKPVKYVINTHGHDDHITGNQIYREAFPAVEFIGHSRMREYLSTSGETNRKQMIEGAPKFVAYIRGEMEKGKSIAGGDLTQEERTAFESDFRLVDRYMAEVPGSPIVLPTIAVTDRLTLHRTSRTIDIRHLGRGHTAGDLVVYLPEDGIAITGDLVVWPIPLVGEDQSHVRDWSATLGNVKALKPRIVVPGHGPVMRDLSYLDQMSGLFASVREQVDTAKARGETLEQVRKSTDLSAFKQTFAADSKLYRFLFDMYVTGPAVTSAFNGAPAAVAPGVNPGKVGS